MESKQFDSFFEEIDHAFKTGMVYICPDCAKVTNVHANPYYYHECEHCGRKGYYTQLQMKTVKESIKEILHKYETV